MFMRLIQTIGGGKNTGKCFGGVPRQQAWEQDDEPVGPWSMRDSNLPKKRGKNEPFLEPEAKSEAMPFSVDLQFSTELTTRLQQLIDTTAAKDLRAWLKTQPDHLQVIVPLLIDLWTEQLKRQLKA